ncbi:MAG: hypothetical protein NC923_08200, partial [Candidatus Omnitrophica bacterium]|nr:hypothetical protein [Candidatus Omnitrophota bacterium]
YPMTYNKLLHNNKLHFAFYLAVCFYLFLCIVRYINAKPLWLDENFILDNLKNLGFTQLFGPLQHSQGFPRLYLFLIKAVSAPFGYNVYMLRFFPFLAMVAAFFIWLSIFRKEEKEISFGMLLFVLSWCGSSFMSRYCAELKQYSIDVLTAALFTRFLVDQGERAGRGAPMLVYLLMPSLVLFSYPAYFFISLPVYNLALALKSDKTAHRKFYLYCVSAFIFIIISLYYDVRFTIVDKGLSSYWNDYFISFSSGYELLKSLSEGLRNIFVKWYLGHKLVTRLMTVFMPWALIYIIIAAFRSLKKNRGAVYSPEAITLFLLIELFVAASLKLYPFTGERVTLFISSFIFYAIIKSILALKHRLRLVYLAFAVLYVLILVNIAIYLAFLYLFLPTV